MGDSRGHWEGNTLVVDVTSFSDSTWWMGPATIIATRCTWLERYTRMDQNTLIYEATIDDPKVFTRSWKIRMPLHLQTGPGAQILENECVERRAWRPPSPTLAIIVFLRAIAQPVPRLVHVAL